jgi:hypothetical protein
MSSSTLTIIQTYLPKYGYPIFMVLGNIGNVFIIRIFRQQRQTACSLYLISAAVVNIVYLTITSFVTIFPFYYADGTIRAIILCKIYTYAINVIGQIAKTMLVLACIDRFLITSTRASFRAFSTPKQAKYLIFFSIIFWLLLAIHIPITRTIVNGQCGVFGIYSTIYSVYAVIFVGLIPPIISGIFGYLIYHNMRQRNIRVQPVVQNLNDANTPIRRKDRDLLIIVISEVFFNIVTTAPFSLVQLEMLISRYAISNKSIQYSQIESFIFTIGYLLLLINSAAPFYIYLISSKSFRRDFKRLIINIYQKLTKQTPVQIVPRIHQTIAQREIRV